MKKHIIIIITLFIYQISMAQSNFERGAIEGELFVTTYVNNPNYYDIEKGLLHITNNGADIKLMYHTRLFEDTGIAYKDTLVPHYIVADATPGIIYNYYTYNGYSLYRSSDYGTSWKPVLEEINHNGNRFHGGAVEGNIYWAYSGGLYFSDNYGETFDTLNDVVPVIVFDVGFEAGELLAREYFFTDTTFPLYKMENNSGVFNQISDISNICKGSPNFKFSRGARDGELYIFLKESQGGPLYKHIIYFSPDYGKTCYLRNTSDTLFQPYDHFITGGRADGSFYISRTHLDWDIPAWYLEILYSDDTALTFKTYTHILDETVLQEEIKVANIYTSVFPNPFSGNTNISFSLIGKQNITIDIFAINGSFVKKLFSGSKEKGQHNFTWNGTNKAGQQMPKGIYFIKLHSKQLSKTVKVLKM
jgi:FlgD Ig-like domain